MENLSQSQSHFLNLVPSSMSEGGEVHFDVNNIQMTAVGSDPISAPSKKFPGQDAERLPLPQMDIEPEIPVSYPGTHSKPKLSAGPDGSAKPKWDEMDDVPAASRWRQV